MYPSRLAMGAMLLVVQAACREASVPPTATNAPVVIAAEQPGPSAIAVDADFVYWNHVGRGLIRKAPRTGGPAVTLFDGGGDLGGRSIAVDADSVYFDRGFEVMRVPKGGGPATHIADLPSLPAVLVTDDDGVYVTASSTVVRHARGGGESRPLGSDGHIYDVAVDATHVYWVSTAGVRRVAKGGGGAETLARGRFLFSRLALDDTNVYWGDANLQGVLTVAKRGGQPGFVAHGWLTGSERLVVHGHAVWVMHTDGELHRIDPDTGTGVVMAVALARGGTADRFYGLAITDTDLFVAAGGSTLTNPTPGHIIDLMGQGSKLPTFEHGGEILRLPTTPPRAPIHIDAARPEVGRVWFTGMAMQDPRNATRWITTLHEEIVDGVRLGKLGLHLVAFASETVSEPVAVERGKLVEEAIRAQLGGSPRIAIFTSRSPAFHGDVHVTLDPSDLSAALAPDR